MKKGTSYIALALAIAAGCASSGVAVVTSTSGSTPAGCAFLGRYQRAWGSWPSGDPSNPAARDSFVREIAMVSNAGTPPGPILLSATPVAPYQSAGSAEFSGRHGHYLLSISVDRLNPGEYVIGVIRPGGSLIPAGRFTVIDPTESPDRHAYQDTRQPSVTHHAVSLVVQTQAPLPPRLRPSDIDKVVVADTAGNYVLTGVVARH